MPINYQGRLTDVGGGFDGSFDFQFELYDQADGGNRVGDTVVTQSVGVVDGLFSVDLDFGAVDFGDELWLEISVREDDEGATIGASWRDSRDTRMFNRAVENCASQGRGLGSYSSGTCGFGGSFQCSARIFFESTKRFEAHELQ